MEDAKDQHNLAFDLIVNPVATMRRTANPTTELRLADADFRVAAQQIEGLSETARISVRDFSSERVAAKSVDALQVGLCRRTKPDLSHPARGAWR